MVATAIELDPEYLRALLRRAELYEKTDKLDEALEDYKKVLDRDPNQITARQACMVSPLRVRLTECEQIQDTGLTELLAQSSPYFLSILTAGPGN